MNPILVLCADLFFSARFRETARQLGLFCEVVADAASFHERATLLTPALSFIDMNLRSGDAEAAVRRLRADPVTAGLALVGYLHDVQEELMTAAEEAGCDLVLSRGRLTRRLPDLCSGKIVVTRRAQ